MNVIFISPQFPPNYYQFCVELNRCGVNLLAITDEPYDHLHVALKSALTDYYWVSDLGNYDQVLRAVGYFTHRYGKIDRIESLNEHWLTLEAHLRTDFNIFGPQVDDLGGIRRKSQMKQKFITAGVSVAKGRIVNTLAEGKTFIKEVGYPVVAKPDSGVGATDTFKITTAQELKQFFAHKPPVDYFMEEFVSGTICTFDGLTNQQGEPVFFTSHEYSQGVMEVVNQDDHVYYYSYRHIPPDLEKAGRLLLQAFNVRERFFHFEFFRTNDNQLVAIEVNMRPPGGLTVDMFNYANDINLYAEWANIVTFNQFRATYTRPYHCAHIGRKLYKPYRYSAEKILARYREEIVHHQRMHPLFARAMGDYAYIVRTPELSNLLEMAEYIQALQ